MLIKSVLLSPHVLFINLQVPGIGCKSYREIAGIVSISRKGCEEEISFS